MYSKWLLLYMLAQVYLTNWQWLSVVCNLSKTIFVVTVVTRQSEASLQQISTSPQYRHRIKRSSCVTIAWHVDASNFVCTLVNNGKLANQIAILPPVVHKYIGRPSTSNKTVLLRDHCVTRWREQFCLYSCQQRQIGQSDRDITASRAQIYQKFL